jgi:hypothetical protein
VIRVQNERDPKEFLEKVMSAQQVPLMMRTQAAGLLMPFCYARCTERRVSVELPFPMTTNAREAKTNIAAIKMFVAAGRLGIDEGNDLIAMETKLIEAHAIVEMEADLAGPCYRR